MDLYDPKPMPAKEKPKGRPLRGNEPLTERISAMFSERERAALEEIAKQRYWPTLSILVREAIEHRYPEIFRKPEEETGTKKK